MTNMNESRQCIDCSETKPLSEFPRNGKGHRSRCKPCYSAYVYAARQNGMLGAGRTPGRGKAIVLPDSHTGQPKLEPRPVPQIVVLIDRTNGQYVMCSVVSEKAITNEATVEYIARFYAQLGYRVVDGVEAHCVQQTAAAGD